MLGRSESGIEVTVPACSVNLLPGPSGAGKSTLAKAFLEALPDAGYQFCAIDPEGDYEEFEPALMLGSPQHPPSISEVIKALEKPSQSVVVNLLGLELENRPSFFRSLLLRLQEMRARTGRPHCVVVDEAHHFHAASSMERELFPSGSLWGTSAHHCEARSFAGRVFADRCNGRGSGEGGENTSGVLFEAGLRHRRWL